MHNNTSITPFSFDNLSIRVVLGNEGEIWFVAKDVCDALGFTNTKDGTRMLDDEEKGGQIVHTPGGPQTVTIINESGLYSLIMRSRRPEAKKFKKWVTSEVISQGARYAQ